MKEYELRILNGETKVFYSQTEAENYIEDNPDLHYELWRIDVENDKEEFIDGNSDEFDD